MIIRSMTASFGSLNNAVLRPGEGLTVIQAPNEAGKSTWSAFLQAMFYGIDTKERARAGHLPDKSRFQPWDQRPMEGRLELSCRLGDLSIQRESPRATAPMARCSVVYTGTGDKVPDLEGDTLGETLLGVPRSVYQRSAFLRQAGLAVQQSEELEQRIAALVSTGDETYSYTKTQERLAAWLRRRKFNKTGRIPQLEGELAALEADLVRLKEVQAEAAALEGRGDLLDGGLEELYRQQRALEGRRRAELLAEHTRLEQALAAANGELLAAEAVCEHIGPREELFQLRAEYAALERGREGLKLSRLRAEEAARQAEEWTARLQSHPFAGRHPQELRAERDAALAELETLKQQKTSFLPSILCVIAGAAAAVAAALLWRNGSIHPGLIVPCPVAGVLLALVFRGRSLQSRARIQEQMEAIRRRWPAEDPEAPLREYEELWTRAETYDRMAQGQLSGTLAQERALQLQEQCFDQGFALNLPDAEVEAGPIRAIGDALTALEALEQKRQAVRDAQWALEHLPPLPEAAAEEYDGPLPDRAELDADLRALTQERDRVRLALAAAEGSLTALGDPAALEQEVQNVREELARCQREYQALDLALKGLQAAQQELQNRFSPALNQETGRLFARLTGHRWQAAALDRELNALARSGDSALFRSVLSLSQGTGDQLYLALRLAICKLLLPADDPAPLVLDDVFANFDEGRLAAALDLLLEEFGDRQILLFTCQDREARQLAGRPGVTLLQCERWDPL